MALIEIIKEIKDPMSIHRTFNPNHDGRGVGGGMGGNTT